MVTSSTTNSLQQEWLTNALDRPIIPMLPNPSTSNGCYFCWSCGYLLLPSYFHFVFSFIVVVLLCSFTFRSITLHSWVLRTVPQKSSLQLDPVRVYISHLPSPSTFLHCPATPGWRRWWWCISICDTEAEHPTKIGNNILGHQFISFTVPNDLHLCPSNTRTKSTTGQRLVVVRDEME